jgi:DNA-binding transcriptional LysR family regulator
MDVRQLKVLLAVIETGSLGKAADRLHLTQPAVTKIIQRLEEELGVALFTRGARGMSPTKYADALFLHAQNATASLTQAAKDIEVLKNGSESTVSVASSPVIGGEILPQAIKYLADRRPNINIKVALEPAESLHDLILEHKVDFAIGVLGETKSSKAIREELLFYDKLVIVARPGHPLTRNPEVRPQDLGLQDWIAPDDRSLIRHRLQHLFEAWKLPLPHLAVECRSPALAKQLVGRTDYVSLLARLAANAELNDGSLSAIEVHGANFDQPVGLLWPKSKPLSSASRALIQQIKRVCEQKGLVRDPQIAKRPRIRR